VKPLLPSVLTRLRDVDPNNRRVAYFSTLKAIPFDSLDAKTREEIIRIGLRDREVQVRKRAVELVAGWVEDEEEGVLKVSYAVRYRLVI
jgi:hypothetical protein